MNGTPLIFIVYDGIENAIFSGQVIQPLKKQKQANPDQPIILICYERSKHLNAVQHKKIAAARTAGIQVIIEKKYPFIGRLSLWPARYRLAKILAPFSSYTMCARGPLAGYITRAAATPACTKIIIQARGLLAQEYAYRTQKRMQSRLTKWWHTWRYKQLKALESIVYTQHATTPTTIDTVSPALKKYLISAFGVDSNHIHITTNDIPQSIAPDLCATWRTNIRTQLSIAQTATVYCYSGSLQAWQCPEQTIRFFKQELQNDPTSILLVLTKNTLAYKNLLQVYSISPENYRITTVDHAHIYHYLAAADVGLIFREPHVMNWVSRPTKVLEYQAVGLRIVHNNTVAWLVTTKQP